MNEEARTHSNHMLFTSIVAIMVGLVFLSYPGGPVAMVQLAFWALQLIVSIFVLTYTISEAYAAYKTKGISRAVLFLILGVVIAATVWLFDVRLIYVLVALFLLFSGLVEVIGAVQLVNGRFFMALLGVLNIMLAAVMFKYPVILPLLISWYILFWGISRFFLSLELRKVEL